MKTAKKQHRDSEYEVQEERRVRKVTYQPFKVWVKTNKHRFKDPINKLENLLK